ncbi:MAG: hypothetical protein II553_02810, partial [Lachnospiraceae bacterium]|nr:hypothetical protein [Lachnospiraceae bacterium]
QPRDDCRGVKTAGIGKNDFFFHIGKPPDKIGIRRCILMRTSRCPATEHKVTSAKRKKQVFFAENAQIRHNA